MCPMLLKSHTTMLFVTAMVLKQVGFYGLKLLVPWVWIQFFGLLDQLLYQSGRVPSALLFTYSWWKKRWIHAFYKGLVKGMNPSLCFKSSQQLCPEFEYEVCLSDNYATPFQHLISQIKQSFKLKTMCRCFSNNTNQSYKHLLSILISWRGNIGVQNFQCNTSDFWTQQPKFKSRTMLFVFHIALIALGKVGK